LIESVSPTHREAIMKDRPERDEPAQPGMPQTRTGVPGTEAEPAARSTDEGYRMRTTDEAYQLKRPARSPVPAATSIVRAYPDVGARGGSIVAADAVFAVARVAVGFIFLWVFLDKLFGLGRATKSADAWINGGSPTKGFLSAVDGPFAGMFTSMAGTWWADWLFMIGMGAVGTALILGIGMIVAAVAGPLLMVMIWMASLPLAANPFVDQHIIFSLLIIGLAVSRLGEPYSLGRWWAHTRLVAALPWLR
jgi:thiosulfate dehydrogenase [quinone] large subunit